MKGDQESIVYGCIKDVNSLAGGADRRRANRNAILELPSADEWPFLCRDMFSIPTVKVKQSQYHTDVIHFGASYRAVEYEWDQWMKKFEELLARMYWVSATVHLETELSGTHSFSWESDGLCHEPGSGNMQVRCEWTHEGRVSRNL
ncbi:hypothetical protein [Biformimicrobium ophioploci]|uniref:Uncharacterized protein n=1 Tax=Biformimicrobium ophioploci TaxID=3036711 RepID=A0ABQ6LZY5_9GAMM|nr:hypothetical protein [Microbulbifer sp. NKW57]GMG87663.1 hypothetical protein MNKW57_19840 [Microbulbifer sp. NKW57]